MSQQPDRFIAQFGETVIASRTRPDGSYFVLASDSAPARALLDDEHIPYGVDGAWLVVPYSPAVHALLQIVVNAAAALLYGPHPMRQIELFDSAEGSSGS